VQFSRSDKRGAPQATVAHPLRPAIGL
jgi:hypothetical protein